LKNLLKSAALAAIVLAPVHANAVTADIPFSGSVTHTCVITVGPSGTLGVSSDFKTLSSLATGGSAGSASVVSTGNGFDVSVTAPSSFSTSPTEDTSSTAFTASYTVNNGSSQSSASDLTNGTHAIKVNMAATKSGSNIFEAGAYAATVVLRCE